MRLHRWNWQDWILFAIERFAFFGVLVLLSLICWQAFVW
jgi:hypothetical protein